MAVGYEKFIWIMNAAMMDKKMPKPTRWKPMNVSDGHITPSRSWSKKSQCCCRTVWCACFSAQPFAVVPYGDSTDGARLTRAVPAAD